MWKEVWEGNCDYLHILVRTESEVGAVTKYSRTRL
jgi:hypothetical protein